jgi:hypothetical protein
LIDGYNNVGPEMKISRSLKNDGTVGPIALNFLAGIPQNHLFFREHQLRHPVSIYNLSLDKLTKAFIAVVEEYGRDTIRFSVEPNGGFDIKGLLQAQEHLLHCLQEHLDDCYLILKTLIDPAKTNATAIAANEFVADSKLPGSKSFVQAADEYRRSLTIVNKLKHNQGRLRGYGIYPGDGIYLGYFLEEPDKEGVVGPSPEIHPNQGAFSFARDLKLRFFLVYSLSGKLVKAVERALLGLYQTSLPKAAGPQQKTDDWNRLVALISKIPNAIFPRELNLGVATIHLTDDGQELTMRFPDRIRVAYRSATGRAVVSTVGDGFSRQFKVPLP